MSELLPAKASFRPGEAIEIEVRGTAPAGPVRVWHLHELVAELAYTGGGVIALQRAHAKWLTGNPDAKH